MRLKCDRTWDLNSYVRSSGCRITMGLTVCGAESYAHGHFEPRLSIVNQDEDSLKPHVRSDIVHATSVSVKSIVVFFFNLWFYFMCTINITDMLTVTFHADRNYIPDWVHIWTRPLVTSSTGEKESFATPVGVNVLFLDFIFMLAWTRAAPTVLIFSDFSLTFLALTAPVVTRQV